jgi:nitroreductase
VVLAATALGLGAVWKSAAVLDTPPVRTLFGLTPHERLLGWVNLGTAEDDRRRTRRDTPPADLSTLVTVIDGDGNGHASAPPGPL